MEKILVVEDDSDLRLNLDAILSGEGYQVLFAEDGKKGFTQAVNSLPDLILADISLPYCNGYQLLDLLKENSSTFCIPFIFLTARAEERDIRMGMANGADDYITKPFDIDDLLTSIRTRLDKRKKHLTATNDLKNSFFRKVPHELRTPLVSILGFSECIENDIERFSKDELREIICKIHASGSRLLRRIEKFLEYTELMVLITKPTELDGLFKLSYCVRNDNIMKCFNRVVKVNNYKHPLQLDFETAHLPIPGHFYEMLVSEIVENAIKFSSPDTSIYINGSKTQGTYTTTVINEGTHFTKIMVDRIEEFNQFGNENMNDEGMGLGLVIVKKILLMFGGTIQIVQDSMNIVKVMVTMPCQNCNCRSISP